MAASRSRSCTLCTASDPWRPRVSHAGRNPAAWSTRVPCRAGRSTPRGPAMAFRAWPRSRRGRAAPEPRRGAASRPIRRGRKWTALQEIDALQTKNRRRRRPRIEERLVQLRLDGLAELDRSSGPRDWPPGTADPFTETRWPPEVSRDELTLEALQGGIFHHGCLLVRGLLDREQVDHLVSVTNQAFEGFHAYVRGDPPSVTTPWYVPRRTEVTDNERVWCRDGGGVLAVESPRGLFEIIETFEQVGIGSLVTQCLGERPTLLARKWLLRCVPPGIDSEWHQDGAFMGEDIRTVNVWLPLSACGGELEAPGLDIVARRLDHVVTTGTDGARLDWTVGPGMVERVAQGRVARPTFGAGDALLFDHLFLHRTDQRPQATKNRYAIEAWFAAPSSYPPKELPIVY